MSAVFNNPRATRGNVVAIEESPVSRLFFANTRMSWLWLVVRLYVGYEWVMSALGKLGNPAWTGDKAGAAITGFVNGALQKAGGEHPDVTQWYASFLQNVVLPNARLWSFMITFGELLVGIALIVGIFTGIAAFFGAFMNVNYLLAGTVSSNPVLFVLALFLVMAWRIAGWIGLDRWILPALGTPWRPGFVFHERDSRQQSETGG